MMVWNKSLLGMHHMFNLWCKLFEKEPFIVRTRNSPKNSIEQRVKNAQYPLAYARSKDPKKGEEKKHHSFQCYHCSIHGLHVTLD